MVFGTFDGLHRGHLHFFRQAKKLGRNAYLIVSVARDLNVKKIKKRLPEWPEDKRASVLRRVSSVDKVVLSGIRNHLLHIIKERPDIIALGYDQRHYVKNLRADLKKRGLLVKIRRLRPYKPDIFKNRLLKKKRGL